MSATDLLQIRQLGDVMLSPDGRQVLYSVRSIVPKEDADSAAVGEYVYRTHLYATDPFLGGEVRQLTRGEMSATDAAWHPEGDRIAFVRNVDDTPQIFILPLLGGEAYPITDLESGASSPRWSPDGSMLLFSSSLTAEEIRSRTRERARYPLERAGRRAGDADDIKPDPNGSVAEIRAWLDANAADGRPRVFHRLEFQGEMDLDDTPEYRHWFVVDADSVAADPVLITRGYYNFGGGAWMADGNRVLVSGKMTTDLHPDRVWDSELYVASADGSGMESFFALDGYSISSPVVSPDGNAVAFTATRLDHAGYAQNEIGVIPIDGESLSASILTLDFDRSASVPKWSPDGWYLYFTAASNGGFPLYRVPAFDVPPGQNLGPYAADSVGTPADFVETEANSAAADSAEASADSMDVAADTPEVVADSIAADSLIAAETATAAESTPSRPRVERLTAFDRGIRSFDIGSAAVFYVATEVANPYELYASSSPFETDRRLTSHNAEWLAEKRLSHPESYTITRDGFEIQYWIMKPAFFDSSGSYPMLLQIHGGPAAMWGPGEASMWHEFQFFASRGYGIVYSNPRGSGGYGFDFKSANYQDWGAGPAGDVLAVASAAVEQPWLDASRQVVTGGSYAGYLTAWIVGHDDRFKAAVAQRGVYDLGTFLGEGNAWRLVPTHFGGYPWERTVDSTRYVQNDRAALPEPGFGREPVADGGSDTLDVNAGPAADSPGELIAQADSVATGDSTAVADTLAMVDSTEAADSIAVVDSTAAADSLAAAQTDSTAIEEAAHDIPEPAAEVLIRNSPLTYVDQIRTPLLIIHSDQDLRTGVIQSEVLYKSLKILDRPVEYVRYPESGHDLSRSGDPRLRIDRVLRIYEFMERFIR